MQVFSGTGGHLATLPPGNRSASRTSPPVVRAWANRCEARAVDPFGLRSEPRSGSSARRPSAPDRVVRACRPLREAGWTDIRVARAPALRRQLLNRAAGRRPPAPPTADVEHQPSVTFAREHRGQLGGGRSGPLEAGGRRLVEGDGGPHGEGGWTHRRTHRRAKRTTSTASPESTTRATT